MPRDESVGAFAVEGVVGWGGAFSAMFEVVLSVTLGSEYNLKARLCWARERVWSVVSTSGEDYDSLCLLRLRPLDGFDDLLSEV
jgi:hypothetical protein